MWKLLKRLTFIFVAVFAALFLEACGEETDITNTNLNIFLLGPGNVPVQEVRLCVGQVWSFNLNLTNAIVTSADTTVVKVRQEGIKVIVTAVNLGTTSLTLSANNASGKPVPVFVDCGGIVPPPPTEQPRLTRIDYVPRGDTMFVAQSGDLIPSCFDQNNKGMQCPPLTWTSSNILVATVSQLGRLTCLTVGSAAITLSAPGVQSVTYMFHCRPAPSLVQSYNVINANNCPGFQAIWNPPTVTVGGALVAVTGWVSNNAAVASVNQSTGVITLTSMTGHATVTGQTPHGQVVITVNMSACPPTQPVVTSVTVSPKTLSLTTCQGSTGQLTATVLPSNAPQGVTWTSSNNAVASVNSNGLVTGVGVGTAVVTVRSTSDASQFDTVTVTVTACPPPPQTVCSVPSIDYSPKGGTIGTTGAARFRTISLDNQSNWPSNCDVIWTAADPAYIMVNGADRVTQVDGLWFYSGKNATLMGLFDGTRDICAHVIGIDQAGVWTRTGVKRCYAWTASSSVTSSFSLDPLSLLRPMNKYQGLEWVQQKPLDHWK